MSTQMWSSFPAASHLFMSYLVLLPFPCESLGLNLKADQKASLFSPLDNFCLYSSHSLCFPCPSISGDPGPVLPLHSDNVSCPLSLCCLPLKPASPPVLMSHSLLPYHSAAPDSPWLPNRPQVLLPTSVLSFSQLSSLLTSKKGFAPFLLLLRALLCPISSSALCLSSAFRAACWLPCQAQPGCW